MTTCSLDQASGAGDLDADRQEFRTAALEWWEVIQRRHRASADPEIDRMHELSRWWMGRQKVRELLTPLLAEGEPIQVRVCAAKHLYGRGIGDVEPLLRELAKHPDEVVTRPVAVALREGPGYLL